MSTLTRRGFARRMLLTAFVPFQSFRRSDAQETAPASTPDTIAGHRLTDEEQRLAAKFHASHEASMGPLRTEELPNDLSPVTSFRAPAYQTRKEQG